MRKNLPPTMRMRRRCRPAVERKRNRQCWNGSSYRGWENAYRISNATIELVVLADVGPRILSYAFVGGENIFHEVPEQAGLTGGHEFRLYGGHRLWVWPEVDRTYFPDNSPVTVSQSQNHVSFTAPVESAAPGSNLQKELEIRLDEGSRVTVRHRVTNQNSRPTELAVWAPTMMKARRTSDFASASTRCDGQGSLSVCGTLDAVVFHGFCGFAMGSWDRIYSIAAANKSYGSISGADDWRLQSGRLGRIFSEWNCIPQDRSRDTRGHCIPISDAISKYSPIPIFSNLRAWAQKFSWGRERARVTRKAGHYLKTSLVGRTIPGFVAQYCRLLLTSEIAMSRRQSRQMLHGKRALNKLFDVWMEAGKCGPWH